MNVSVNIRAMRVGPRVTFDSHRRRVQRVVHQYSVLAGDEQVMPAEVLRIERLRDRLDGGRDARERRGVAVVVAHDPDFLKRRLRSNSEVNFFEGRLFEGRPF